MKSLKSLPEVPVITNQYNQSHRDAFDQAAIIWLRFWVKSPESNHSNLIISSRQRRTRKFRFKSKQAPRSTGEKRASATALAMEASSSDRRESEYNGAQGAQGTQGAALKQRPFQKSKSLKSQNWKDRTASATNRVGRSLSWAISHRWPVMLPFGFLLLVAHQSSPANASKD